MQDLIEPLKELTCENDDQITTIEKESERLSILFSIESLKKFASENGDQIPARFTYRSNE